MTREDEPLTCSWRHAPPYYPAGHPFMEELRETAIRLGVKVRLSIDQVYRMTVIDPGLPEHLREQTYVALGAQDWKHLAHLAGLSLTF